MLCIQTWFGGICLASLGTKAVLPAHCGVLDKAGYVAEELTEAHVGSVVNRVVEQSGTPQVGLFP